MKNPAVLKLCFQVRASGRTARLLVWRNGRQNFQLSLRWTCCCACLGSALSQPALLVVLPLAFGGSWTRGPAVQSTSKSIYCTNLSFIWRHIFISFGFCFRSLASLVQTRVRKYAGYSWIPRLEGRSKNRQKSPKWQRTGSTSPICSTILDSFPAILSDF